MKVFNNLKIKILIASLFIVMVGPLLSVNSYALSEEEFVIFTQEFEHLKPKLSDSPEELMQKSHNLNELLEVKVPQLDEAEQLRYTREIQFYINECGLIYNYNARNWFEAERYFNNRVELLSTETTSRHVCLASLNCCKIMNMMENSILSVDDIMDIKGYLALNCMVELSEVEQPAYIITKLEMKEHWPIIYNMIYGISGSIANELEERPLQATIHDTFYVDPNDIFCPRALAMGVSPEVASENPEALRETSQLSEGHTDIPVTGNDYNANRPSSEDLEFEIIELPNENIEMIRFDIPDIQLHIPEIHLDYNPEIHLDNNLNINLDSPRDIRLDVPDIQLDIPDIPFYPPEPHDNYTLVPDYDVIQPLFVDLSFDEEIPELPPLEPAELGDIDFAEPIIIPPIGIDVQQIIEEIANENTDTVCPICQEKIEDEIAAKPLFCHCGTLYHRDCLEEWFTERSMCPICRTHPQQFNP